MGHRSRRLVALAALPALALAVVLALSSRSPPAPAATLLPAPPKPAWIVPEPRGLPALHDVSHWAPVLHAVLARAAPASTAAVVAPISARTPEGTANILQLLGQARQERSGLWEQARLAVLPNGTTGWVPRSALGGLVVLDTLLVVDRARFRLTLLRDGKQVFSAPVGVGQAQWPTPLGQFYVRDVLTRYRSPTYGPIAFGTSARSAVLTDWPAGGYVGIHGTDQPNLIPGAISHGCIRMRNEDILKLARLMPVGTPITVTG